jgi:hypothetical protein
VYHSEDINQDFTNTERFTSCLTVVRHYKVHRYVSYSCHKVDGTILNLSTGCTSSNMLQNTDKSAIKESKTGVKTDVSKCQQDGNLTNMRFYTNGSKRAV